LLGAVARGSGGIGFFEAPGFGVEEPWEENGVLLG
jgi:hypothetical protein